MVSLRAAAICLLIAAATLPVCPQPRQLLIIRHAEKPDSNNHPNMTARGYSRAAALVQFFGSSFDTPCGDSDSALDRALVTLDSTVVDDAIIRWHHRNLRALANALGVDDVPKSWPDDVFDRVWNIQFGDNGPTLQNLPQHVLFGDSEQ